MIRRDIIMSYELHDYCLQIPEMDSATFEDLVADIKQNGQREPIVLYENKILDGRSRYQACLKAGIEPVFTTLVDALSPGEISTKTTKDEQNTIAQRYVVSQNVHRRHLNASQRAMIAARMSNLGGGKPTSQVTQPVVSQKETAKQMAVGSALVSQAAHVMKKAPETVAEIQAGRKTVSAAYAEMVANEDPTPNNDSVFMKAIADGTPTGKSFRKRINELSKLIDQCTIALPLTQYLNTVATLQSLENHLVAINALPLHVQTKELEKRIVSLTKEQDELVDEVNNVIEFVMTKYDEWDALLTKTAATDEEKAMLAKVQGTFEEAVKQMQEDLRLTKLVHCDKNTVATVAQTGKVVLGNWQQLDSLKKWTRTTS